MSTPMTRAAAKEISMADDIGVNGFRLECAQKDSEIARLRGIIQRAAKEFGGPGNSHDVALKMYAVLLEERK